MNGSVQTAYAHNTTMPSKAAGAGRWWPMPVIPATQEAAIRRISVQSQPGQIVHKTPS
jgi:hypothetical protein